MQQAALILEDRFLYWNSIILMLAVCCAILAFLGLSVRKKEQWMASVAAVPLSLLLSILLARAVHWYCRPQSYESFSAAVTDFSRGGYALIGTFGGCILAAVLLKMLGLCRDLPGMLDRMAIGGSLGIAVGRPAALLTTADRGMILSDTVPFPWASQILNGVSGKPELRLSVFMLQSLAAGLLFVGLLIFYLSKEKCGKGKSGEVSLLFLLLYGASQAVMDSMRYDSIYFRSNGFVSVVQIFSILSVLLVMGIYGWKLYRQIGGRAWIFSLFPLPFLGLAAYMEYYVQRHGSQAVSAYTVMSLSMTLAILTIFFMRAKTAGKGKEMRKDK